MTFVCAAAASWLYYKSVHDFGQIKQSHPNAALPIDALATIAGRWECWKDTIALMSLEELDKDSREVFSVRSDCLWNLTTLLVAVPIERHSYAIQN